MDVELNEVDSRNLDIDLWNPDIDIGDLDLYMIRWQILLDVAILCGRGHSKCRQQKCAMHSSGILY